MEEPTVYPDRARIERRERTLVTLRVPYSGQLDAGLRRRASALLRTKIVDGSRVRGAVITLEPADLVVALAGTPDTIDAWTSSGKLARAAALAVIEAHDQDRRRHARALTAVGRVHARWAKPTGEH